MPTPASTPALKNTVIPSLPVKLTSPDFRARISLATEKDTAKGMFFNGLLDAVEKLLDKRARDLCQQASGEKKFVDFFNYPIAMFLQASFTAAELMAPAMGGHDAAFRKMGYRAANDFLNSGVGKTLLILAGHDPNRILSAVPTAFKTSVSYGERTVSFIRPRQCLVKFVRDFMPHPYHEGVLAAAVEAMHSKNVKVFGRRLGTLDAEYEVTWEPLETGGAA